MKKKEQDNVIHQNSKTWNKGRMEKMENMNFFLLFLFFFFLLSIWVFISFLEKKNIENALEWKGL